MSKPALAPSKAEQCFQILKRRISDCTYGPGHRLVIDQLVREHKISSVPWRESLRRLEAEGWVEIIPNVGAAVRTFDTGSWQRTLQLVARLEGYATALSAPHLDAQDLARARALNREMAQALADFDPLRVGQLNRQFRQVLCSRCDDTRLNDLVAAEWARLELIRRSAAFFAPGRVQSSVVEHDALLDLIESGADVDTIEAAARQHELNTVKAVARYSSEQSRTAAGVSVPS